MGKAPVNWTEKKKKDIFLNDMQLGEGTGALKLRPDPTRWQCAEVKVTTLEVYQFLETWF